MKLRAGFVILLAIGVIAGCSDDSSNAEAEIEAAQEEMEAELSQMSEEVADAMDVMQSEIANMESELANAEAELAAATEELKSELADVQAELNDEANTVMERAQSAAAAAAGEVTATTGAAYLHINAQKPNVTVTDSGLQIEMLESGDGQSPGPTSLVVTHYHGTFTDGSVFDSSVERGEPAQFPVNRVIPGWTEALQMMKEGDKWRLVIPPDLAYGKRGAGDRIPPDSVLIFEVELIEVKN